MFNLSEYIKRNLIEGFKDNTFSESKIMQLCIGYLTKGLLTEEDIADIDNIIQSIKAERERVEVVPEPIIEDIPEEVAEEPTEEVTEEPTEE